MILTGRLRRGREPIPPTPLARRNVKVVFGVIFSKSVKKASAPGTALRSSGFDAAFGQAERQHSFLCPRQAAITGHQPQQEVVAADPARPTTTWNIAPSEWIWLPSQPERGAHGPDDEQTTLRYHQPHIFAPERFFTCVWPSELSAPAGPCEPTPITSNESFTLPAFSNSSMSDTLSPCLSGFLRSISIR